MSYDITATYSNEQRKLEGSFPVQLFCVNASSSGFDPYYYANINQDIYGYSLNASGDITSGEQIYTGLPIDRDDQKTNIMGEIDDISISVPNTNRVVESLIQNRNYLRGNDVYIMSFFAKHLPSGATADYIGESADYRANIKEKYYIDSTTSNEQVVTFQCKSKFNIKNIALPGRAFNKECSWDFESTDECNASATLVASYITCNKTLEHCKQRKNDSRFGGFVSIPSRSIHI